MLSKVIHLFFIINLVSFQNEVAGEVNSLFKPPPKLDADYQIREIPKALKTGTTLEIRGQTVYPAREKNFTIDFMDKPDGDVIFRMRYDYGDGVRSRKIMFNSLEDGRWKNEERYDEYVPYGPNLIQITLLVEHFQIVINKYHEYIFKYRVPTERIKYFGYGGYYKFDSVTWN